MKAFHTEEYMKKLPQSMISLCFQRATRGDEVSTINGTLCRGEFFEMLLRMVKTLHPQKHRVSPQIQTFLNEFMLPIYNASSIVPDRKYI
jgi:hypothetical protein